MEEKFNELVMQVHKFVKSTKKPFYVCMFNDEKLLCSGMNISGNNIISGSVAALYENLKGNKNAPGAIMKAIIKSALLGKYCIDGGFSQKEVKDLHKVIDSFTEGKIKE